MRGGIVCAISFEDSYLGQLRRVIGHDLVLMPGAVVVLQRDDCKVLLTKRADDGTWCAPAGAAEPGCSARRSTRVSKS
jgi:8-oxo-dGTP pyrophosphatase MutT (NUDIX family)